MAKRPLARGDPLTETGGCANPVMRSLHAIGGALLVRGTLHRVARSCRHKPQHLALPAAHNHQHAKGDNRSLHQTPHSKKVKGRDS